MKLKLNNINDYTRELTCVVPWENLKESFQNEFDRMKSNHTPKGGRKGKVTGINLEIFKKNYGPAIEANFAEKSLNEYYNKIKDTFKFDNINNVPIQSMEYSIFNFGPKTDPF